MAFLMEAGRLTAVERATWTVDGARMENSAEHSWHLALFAMTLSDEAPEGVSIDRVIRMLLLHDLVEIDSGDLPFFADGAEDSAAQAAAETRAADRIFGLLPPDQGAAFRALWDEFEANETLDARFAKALDRFQPPNLNLATGGGSWTTYNVDAEMVRRRVGTRISNGAPSLWAWLSPRIARFFTKD
ncbi:putative hydrolases of HD superfamily [Jannaschia seohaensis]|uniref:Putative hydrolase of HD superfamily n=2 Tax=Jannaschia seohaensis TaxID=475081 RepID=A0A2Y9ARB0_9RHOB|nr:HD domain-containing protein [Jannaschia seohaensis]PWJ19196.1 putative hydrolase of HD superfamily [Jannaschia seohaensis]SSA45858.1 putative hydrolases of HD superfamily [Jannaschia seohaensis]